MRSLRNVSMGLYDGSHDLAFSVQEAFNAWQKISWQ